MNRISHIFRVGKLTKFFPAFVFILFSFIAVKAVNTYKVPDFAFPVTVENRSDSLMKEYLNDGNELLALREAMNVCIAKSMTGMFDNGVEANCSLLDSLTKILHYPYKNLTFLIEAEILFRDYSSEPEVYDARNLPLEEAFPMNPSEWSGEMYKTRILQLVDSATNNLTYHDHLDIKELEPLLSNYEEAEKTGLTVPQFITFQGEKLLRNFNNNISLSVIPFYPQEIQNSIESECETRGKSLLKTIIESPDTNPVLKSVAFQQYLSYLPENSREEYLKEAIAQLKGTQGEGILWFELWNRYGQDNYLYYKDITEWLKNYPDGYGSGQLKYAISVMSQQKIEVIFPRISLPDTAIKGEVKVSNLEKGYLLVYRLTPGQYTVYDELILKKFKSNAKPVRIIEINEAGEMPFDYNKDIEISGLPAGLYALIPSKTKTLQKGWRRSNSNAAFATIRVSEISILSSYDSNVKDFGKVFVVKGKTQEPVSGAVVTYYTGDSRAPKGRLTTDGDGCVKIPNGYYRLEATYGKSIARSDAGFNYYPEQNRITPHASILTDLKVYRPGDTVQYAVVGWQQEKISNSLIQNEKVVITLRDANYTEIGRDTLFLNSQGRNHGKFFIPKGRLLGTYVLNAEFPDFPRVGAGGTDIQVEEYKLPSFNISLEQLESVMPDMIRFKGMATTFSGMPVSDARVVAKVEYLPWRWSPGVNNAYYSESLFTNSQGEFELELPLANLKGTPFELGRYSLTADVTSLSGETEKSKPLYFFLGNQCDIRPSIPEKIKVTGDSVSLNIPVYDMAGLPVRKEVEYKVTNKEYPALSLTGVFVSPNLSLPASILLSGKYNLEFKFKEGNEWVSTETVLWRDRDLKVPYSTPLWIPETQYSYEAGEVSVDITFGGYGDEWILYILSDGNKTLETKWISPSEKLIHQDVKIPLGLPTLFVTLAGMHDFDSKTGIIKIVPARSLEKMKVETTSFRDEISAGDKEEWTFKFKVNDNPSPYTNAFAVMSDKALNAIRDFKWNMNIWQPNVYSKVQVNSQRRGQMFSYKSFTSYSTFKPALPIIPSWETYGYPWVSNQMRIGGPVLYKSMATKMAMNDAVMEMEAPQMETSEEAVTETSGIINEKQETEELRPVEMPLAFFMPDLVADEEGLLSLKFTVPNFNTTWQLQVAGYNEDLLNATLVLDAVASKPVMVKSNMPQYLRTGDKAQLSAALYNNSEKLLGVGGKIDVVNPMTGEILVSKDFVPENLEPSGNRVISVDFMVPDDQAYIAVRSYAYGENHSDGEQGLIYIYPSSAPVTDSQTFYADRGEDMVELKLPKFDRNANVTLKYCDNPLWEVLLSLPSLTQEPNQTSLSIGNWLYSTILSFDIIKTHPEISEGIRNILNSKDSTLSMSGLQQDQNLKITQLEASPWLNNANRETERIRSLNQYLDNSYVESLIDSKIDALKSMQNSDGGFSWCPGMKSSDFITSGIIGVLAYLNQDGLLDSRLKSMALKAVGYYDRSVEEYYRKHKGINVNSLVNYFYSRDMLDCPMSKEMKNIKAECLDSIKAKWRHWNLTDKTKGALVLSSDEKFVDEVNVMGASLKEFLNRNNSVSDLALMLEFFEKFQPGSETTDNIKEFIFLQKEIQDWNSGGDYIGVIYALSRDLSSEEIDRKAPEIYVGKQQLIIPETQVLTGDYTINLDPKEVSGKILTIKRESGIPAWGGIVSQYIQPIKDIKATRVADLSVEKRVFKEDAKGKVKSVSSFKKGDRVTVVLNITCSKDMDYVVISDSRAACLQPEESVSGMINVDGNYAYQEIGREKTTFFIEHLPSGNHVISYDCYANREGEYSLGIAEVQCLYSPAQISHTGGSLLKVKQ